MDIRPVLCLSLVCILSAPATAGGFRFYNSLSDSLHLRAAQNLSWHVDAQELAAWRDTCRADEAEAFDFLFAWLPSSDLSAWRAPEIEKDIALALRTRAETPWRAQVSDAVFRSYVLPHRVAQEPVQPWRGKLHDMLWDRVKDKTLREAALETNRFCREWATFQPTSSRDQGPLTTMDRGKGRCEEEEIFYISAARSVGIPARPCYTPWWMANDNNHAWVEVWTGDGWHYLGACEPAPDLDQAWFTGPARRAGLVLSTAYGQGEFPGEEIYAQRAGVTAINSTAVYNRTGRLRAEGIDSAAVVHVHVFNSGGLREIGSFKAGRGIRLGPADYVVSTAAAGRPLAALVKVRPDSTTVVRFTPAQADTGREGGERHGESGRPGTDAGDPELLEKPFWMRIPIPPKAESASAEQPKSVDPLVEKTHEAALARNDLARAQRSRPHPSLVSALAARCCGSPDLKLSDLLDDLELSGPHWSDWAGFLAATPASRFATACGLVQWMDDKDFFECDTTSARAALDRALEVRALREKLEPPVPDSVWIPFVLSPRIDRQPGDFSFWRDLPLFTGPGGGVESAEGICARFAGRIRKAAPSVLGHIGTPSQTLRSDPRGLADSCLATATAARVALVGLLRRNGIPARVEPERRWIECWVRGRWIPADPMAAEPYNKRPPQPEVPPADSTQGVLQVSFLDLGAPMARAEADVHFSLAHFTDGSFQPLYNELAATEGRLTAALEPGDWWLMGGQRNHAGDTRVVLRHFRIAGSDTTRLTVDLGIPPEERDQEDLVPKRLPPEGVAFLRASAPAAKPVLALFWSRDSEPARRTADAILSGRKTLETLGLSLLSVEVTEDGAPGKGSPIPGLPGSREARLPSAGLTAFAGKVELPLIVLLDARDRTRLWTEGMQLAVTDLARQAMESPPGGSN